MNDKCGIALEVFFRYEHMDFYRRFFLVFALSVSCLWARTEYCILPVHLDGVHEDYAEKIVSLTKDYFAAEGYGFVSDASACDYLLQVKLIRKEKGVALVYEKKNKSSETLWSYGHIVYSPGDFASVVSYVAREIDKLETDWIWGFGFGALGMIGPVDFVDYNYEPFVQFRVESVKIALDLNIAFLGSRPHGVHGSVLGPSLSVAYMFGRHFVVPYLGAGINGALFITSVEKEVVNRYGVTEKESESETFGSPGYFFEMGLSLKLKNEVHIMLESRYFREFYKMNNILNGKKGAVHGFSVGVKIGV